MAKKAEEYTLERVKNAFEVDDEVASLILKEL